MAASPKGEQSTYDLVVIGAGPGGYVAAIRAAQLGLRTAIVEKSDSLGGTCLNIGCIPSKALLDSSELYLKTTEELNSHGIAVGKVTLHLPTMLERKNEIVKRLTGGVASLLKGRKVTVFHGSATLMGSPGDLKVTVEGPETTTLSANAIILASGSVPVELPFLPFDGSTVVSSTEALDFDQVPKDLVVVGAGAIGLELGSVWRRLGAQVTVVEIMEQVLPGWDGQVSKTLGRELKKQGFELKLGHKVTGLVPAKGNSKPRVTVESPDGKAIKIPADKVLVAVGRKPFTEGLGIEEWGIKTEDRSGRVLVDNHYQTSVPGVYAIGDLVHGPMLAHKAEDEGIAAVEIIAGLAGHVNYDTIPGVVYTWPEAAMAGMTEEGLKEAGIEYTTGSFQFAANGRALAMDAGVGFVKLLADSETDRLLGAHIVGPWASDLISELVTVMEFGGSAEDVARIVHAHPTLPEAVKEAALAVGGRAIHSR